MCMLAGLQDISQEMESIVQDVSDTNVVIGDLNVKLADGRNALTRAETACGAGVGCAGITSAAAPFRSYNPAQVSSGNEVRGTASTHS